MTTPVNLNRFRKERAREERKERAAENVARFGRTKAEKEAERQRNDRARRDLDGHEKET
jgi:hypothetical protein